MMKNRIYRYIGVVLIVIGIILSATGITLNDPSKTNNSPYQVETLEVLDENMTSISNEKYDDKVVNNGIGSFMIILGTFFLSGHYLMLHRKDKKYNENQVKEVV